MRESQPSDSLRLRSERSAEFTATHWTEVAQAAARDESETSRAALAALCDRYWLPIYAFLRRKGYSPSDSEDLAQGFFAHLIAENAIARADRTRGKFRTFLLGALQRHLIDESRRNSVQKRAGSRVHVSVDLQTLEEGYLEESDPGLTPDQVFDRRWAATILQNAYAELALEFRECGQGDRFEILKRYLGETADEGEYQLVAGQLGLAVKAVSSAVCRLRQRFNDLVHQNVQMTVGCLEEVDEEFQQLFQRCLRRHAPFAVRGGRLGAWAGCANGVLFRTYALAHRQNAGFRLKTFSSLWMENWAGWWGVTDC